MIEKIIQTAVFATLLIIFALCFTTIVASVGG